MLCFPLRTRAIALFATEVRKVVRSWRFPPRRWPRRGPRTYTLRIAFEVAPDSAGLRLCRARGHQVLTSCGARSTIPLSIVW